MYRSLHIAIYSALVAASLSLATNLACAGDDDRAHSANVDVKNGNLNLRVTDLNYSATGYDVRITRSFNSKGSSTGMFGIGWCSDFETKISFDTAGNLVHTECGSGVETPFVAADTYISAFVDDLMKRKDSVPNPSFSTQVTKEELLQDWRVRNRVADELKFKREPDRSAVFLERGRGPKGIKFSNNQIVLTTIGETVFFDEVGRLIRRQDATGNWMAIDYMDGRPEKVRYSSGRELKLIADPDGRVTAAQLPSGELIKYEYNNQRLIRVVGTGIDTKYLYSKNGLLDTILEQNKTAWSFQIDPQRRTVSEIKNSTGCKTNYSYPKERSDIYEVVESKSSCDGINQSDEGASRSRRAPPLSIRKVTYKFEFEDTSNGAEKILRRSRVTDMNRDTEVTYHPIFQKPTSVKEANNMILRGNYDSRGLLESVVDAQGVKTQIEYEIRCRKIQKIRRGDYEKRMQYDDKCNLTDLAESSGTQLSLEYDQKGRITMLIGAEPLMIEYDHNTGKPSIIEMPSHGNIIVTYKTNGEIERVESPGGPQTAVRVASAFNNLLDLIKDMELDDLERHSQLGQNCSCSTNRNLFSRQF